jgi:cytochrome c biogenesis protein CcmG, thiol:disulfide interchange protein DsbE
MLERNALKKNLITLFFIFLFLASVSAVEPGINVGQQAPDFKLKSVSGGNPINLSQYRGKPVFVVFWAAWCGPCRKEIPELKSLHAKYAPKGVEFVSVAVGWRQTEEDIKKFQTAQQLPYQILWDKDNAVADQWGIHSIPTNFIIDHDGVIRYRDFGISPDVETLLQSMVKADN